MRYDAFPPFRLSSRIFVINISGNIIPYPIKAFCCKPTLYEVTWRGLHTKRAGNPCGGQVWQGCLCIASVGRIVASSVAAPATVPQCRYTVYSKRSTCSINPGIYILIPEAAGLSFLQSVIAICIAPLLLPASIQAHPNAEPPSGRFRDFPYKSSCKLAVLTFSRSHPRKNHVIRGTPLCCAVCNFSPLVLEKKGNRRPAPGPPRLPLALSPPHNLKLRELVTTFHSGIFGRPHYQRISRGTLDDNGQGQDS